MIYDVLVIGAGVAGLTAAHKLRALLPNASLLVLEASGRVGGRTLTEKVKVCPEDERNTNTEEEDKFDLGGQWVASGQRHVIDLLSQLDLSTFPQYTTGLKVMQLGGDTVRTYSSDIPSLGSLWALIQLQWFIWKAERLAGGTSILDPGNSHHAHQLEGETVHSFLHKSVSNVAVIQAIDVACKAAFGTDASRISLLYFLAYANAAGGVMKLFEAKRDAAQEARVKGGTQQISHILAERIGIQNLIFNQPVVEVQQSTEDGDTVTIVTKNGARYVARRVILSTPPNQLIKIKFDPPLPPYKRLACENLPMGHLTKFIVVYRKAFWREKGYSGEIVSNGGGPLGDVGGVTCGPLSVCYDATTHSGTPAIVGFIAGRQGIEWHNKTKEEREQGVIKGLCTMLGEEARQYVTYIEKIWSDEPYVGGCPVGFGVPGVTYTLPHLRLPFLRLHFAGTETATEWTGYISGAVQSGERAALEVTHALHPGTLTKEQLRGTCHDAFSLPQLGVTSWKDSRTLSDLFFVAVVVVVVIVAVVVARW
ncbi:hypothetical protein Pcinc_008042 [Petrolisthes cinctipes]|uniref:Amine oxidase n=1 Tax=Petrolisthes cinctipes TaxID=88211 RepID=A0AAE1G862_PETCI|nr:hypothetical protein Pcinc_008042 [Petrolisthes cinctipes]